MGRIHTEKVLGNSWNSGSAEIEQLTGQIRINDAVEKQYDFSVTDDPVALQDKIDTEKIVYDVFKNSPYFEKYGGYAQDSSIPVVQKINRNDIIDLFYYMKTHIDAVKHLPPSELIMQIGEFFDLNYDYLINTVISVRFKSELLGELYSKGIKKNNVDEQERLF